VVEIIELHYLPEENPAATANALLDFFGGKA
jgi:hypothetical protein